MIEPEHPLRTVSADRTAAFQGPIPDAMRAFVEARWNGSGATAYAPADTPPGEMSFLFPRAFNFAKGFLCC